MSYTTPPHYLIPLTNLTNFLLELKPGYDKQLDTRPGPNGSHQAKNLKGNRATLMFHALNESTEIGYGWVGVSGSTAPQVPKNSNIKLLRALDDSTVDVSEIINVEKSDPIPHRFCAAPGHHGKCSEVALINALYHYLNKTEQLKIGRDPENAANLYLVTERLPCPSCTNLLGDFLREFEYVDLHIAYMLDITQDGKEVDVYDFLNNIKNRTYAYNAQIVSSQDRGHQAANGAKQFSPPGVTSVWAISRQEEPGYLLNIIPIANVDGPRLIPPKSMPSRGAGQPSVHFNSLIASGGKPNFRKSPNFGYLLSALCIVGVIWAVASKIGEKRRR